MVAFAKQDCRRAHLVGVAGAGMSALARMLRGVGVDVSGSDAVASPVLRALVGEGLRVWAGAAPERIGGQDTGGWVVRSAAVDARDSEVAACAARGYEPLLYAEAVGRLSQSLATLAVAGAHGKTSTTALLASALHGGGVDASYLVGGELPALGGNGYGGRSDWLAVEACEFNRSFLHLTPRAAAVVNLDHDHFDCYRTHADLIAAFAAFVGRVAAGGRVVVPATAPAELVAACAQDVEVLRVGETPGADLWPADCDERGGCHGFVPVLRGRRLPRVELAVPGRFQVTNALCALALAEFAGADLEGAATALRGFSGVRRRFEIRRGANTGAHVIDDYAHHPTELRAVAEAARARFPGRRLLAVFQPHQHQRTAALFDQFVTALAGFDGCKIVDIYAAREDDSHRALASADQLAAAVAAAGTPAEAVGPVGPGLPPRAVADYRDGDVLLMLGAGDLEQVVDDVVALL